VHKAKGLEWERVKLAPDYVELSRGGEEEEEEGPPTEEINLL
jgi:hypothetical protein